MAIKDLSAIKERIYEENKIEEILEALECEYIKLIGGRRYECQLPPKFHSSNRRSVQVYLTETLPSKIRSKGISGDIYTLVGYILYEATDEEALKEVLHQVKAWICNLFGWSEYLEKGDDFEESPPQKDYLAFLRPIQKERKKRKRLRALRDKENEILDKEKVFSWYRQIGAHVSFLEDGINVRTQKLFEIMYDIETDRVVFPIYNSRGELVSVKGRYVGNDEWTMENIKYLYLYSFDKGIELFNLHRALPHIKKKGEVIVFEAEKSCMKAHQYGFKNTVAIAGSELSPVQAHLLITLEANIIFAFDNDMDEEHVKKQAKQIRTRKCFWIHDTLGLLGDKDAPVDKGKDVWLRLYGECIKTI